MHMTFERESAPESDLEQTRKDLKQKMLDFLEAAKSKVSESAWGRANTTLGEMATAITERDNVKFMNATKTFANMVGHPPFNEHDDLFIMGDEIGPIASKYWSLKYPA